MSSIFQNKIILGGKMTQNEDFELEALKNIDALLSKIEDADVRDRIIVWITSRYGSKKISTESQIEKPSQKTEKDKGAKKPRGGS
jgi:hypothetical protein